METPIVTTLEDVQKQSGYKSVQPVQRPSWADVDLDWSRRPGAQSLHVKEPKPFPNTRFPPERQEGVPAVPKHGRPNKPFPPVFGTSTPLKGLSGAIRAAAYKLPDHKPEHWLLLMLGGRVESWGARVRRYGPLVAPLLAIAWYVRRQ